LGLSVARDVGLAAEDDLFVINGGGGMDDGTHIFRDVLGPLDALLTSSGRAIIALGDCSKYRAARLWIATSFLRMSYVTSGSFWPSYLQKSVMLSLSVRRIEIEHSQPSIVK
jgi:hypothetical protein